MLDDFADRFNGQRQTMDLFSFLRYPSATTRSLNMLEQYYQHFLLNQWTTEKGISWSIYISRKTWHQLAACATWWKAGRFCSRLLKIDFEWCWDSLRYTSVMVSSLRVRKHWGLRSQSTKIAGAVFTFQLPKKNKTVVLCCPTTAFEFILLESCQIPGGYRKLRGFVECCRHIATKHTEGAQTMMIGCWFHHENEWFDTWEWSYKY